MSKSQNPMYTLGKLVRAVWPDGNAPANIVDTVLTRPASGLALIMREIKSTAGDIDAINALIAELPADLADPPGGVSIKDQGPYWTGYYHYASALNKARTLGADDLADAGRTLYGERWQSELARALDIGDRRVRQWIAGERPIPAGIWLDVQRLLRERSIAADAMAESILKKMEKPMSKTAQQIIGIIRSSGAQDTPSIISTLEDGAALLSLGITDEDQVQVEVAHADLKKAYEAAEAWHNATPKSEVLTWYEKTRAAHPDLVDISEDDETLVEDWNAIVIEARVAYA